MTGCSVHRRGALAAASACSVLALAACGGGGGSGGGEVISTPAPPATTSVPTPTPTPTPTPVATNFDTREYRNSDGKAQHNAISAWQQGYSGKGVAIGIVDSGIDPKNPEFAGRISGASRDVAGTRGVGDSDGHGTSVAIVAAAARDDSGVMGMAYEATIIAMRADDPGSCAGADGCQFSDSDIAKGVDAAVAAGARVVNLSLGGSTPSRGMADAVARAGRAGVVVIISAGNDGESTEAGIDPSNPDPFASNLRAAAPDNVIIVGSVGEKDAFSSFSNRAGRDAPYFIAARGEGVCCEYENGALKTVTENGKQYVYTLFGTSFSAPQVAGAAALLAQAFPNLTGGQIVRLLLDSARDAGDPGMDATYGRGVLDIARAFQPRGATALAGTTTQVVVGDGTGITGTAMGDAVRRASVPTVVTDSYGRAYGMDLAGGLARAQVQPRLYGAIAAQGAGLTVSAGRASLAFTVAPGTVQAAAPVPLRLDADNVDRARLLAARIGATIAPKTAFVFGIREGARGLEAGLAGHNRPAFLVAGEGSDELGFASARDGAVAIRHGFGKAGLTLSAETGKVSTDRAAALPRLADDRGDFARYGARFDWSGKAVTLAGGASWLAEDATVLGARLARGFGGGADTLFLDAAAAWRPVPGWSLSADYRRGFTRAEAGGLVAAGSQFSSSAWSVDVARRGFVAANDTLGLRLSQPLRVESGGLGLAVPIGYDYATQSATMGTRLLSLTPSGREMTGELRWFLPLAGGDISTSVFYRKDPGHIADLPDDKGAALRWQAKF